ncbi:MAG TPA: cytochrome c oxidase subunit 3 [Acidimicrobiales bacterium]|nr:cytochrome c oxidase subunit 3 [Acidimicrobiales bacterium]
MSAATATHDDLAHTEVEAYDLVPDEAPAGGARPRVLLVGTALAGGAIITFFAGLIGLYLSVRQGVIASAPADERATAWLADGNPIPLTPANMAFGTLLLSCVTMQWAVDSVRRNDRRNAYFALVMTILFGGAVINATAFLYQQAGLPIAGPSPSGLLFYAVTGAHLALIVGALVFAGLMTVRTLGGEYAGRDREGIVAASVIWYLTTAIFGVIWYAVYVTK